MNNHENGSDAVAGSDSFRSLDAAIAYGFDARDRENMAPTIEYFSRLLDDYPGHPDVLYELGGSYDTAGDGARAEKLYRDAMAAGLAGDRLRRCLLQYGSTLRNLERTTESVVVFDDACERFPRSPALKVFRALSLFADGRGATALASLLVLIADDLDSDDIRRYEAAIRGNAEYLKTIDTDATAQ
ncbi:tetratricopeptide repeat protein [Williamsia sp. MIQD14]|uniref:tetratricopeptide repeat protein n=1 Tax=Williamsia sp. MIQD14 TaxID=3425703 RepID=UPI003DA19A2D